MKTKGGAHNNSVTVGLKPIVALNVGKNALKLRQTTWLVIAKDIHQTFQSLSAISSPAAAPAAAVQEEKPADAVAESSAAASTGRPPGTASSDDSERGRSKGKARVKVVGFEGTNQDGLDDNECVLLSHQMSPCTE